MDMLSTPAVALTAITTALGAAYLNGKFALGHDVHQILNDRAFKARMGRRIQELGDEVSLYHMLELADPQAEAVWFEGRSWTYAEMKGEVDRLAWVLHSHGVKEGDNISVFMTNSPEMIFTIYALTKLGAVPALMNAALRSATLWHCMKVANSTTVVSTSDLAKFVMDLMSEADTSLKCLSVNLYAFDQITSKSDSELSKGVTQIGQDDLRTSSTMASLARPKKRLSDTAALIYTSGTTGKPKAVTVKNFLIMAVSTPLSQDLHNSKRYFPLRTYACLPLFHGTCMFTGLCYSVGNSATFCLSRKFSVSKFSRELTESRATRMLYVGELCRYLLAGAPSQYDRAHSCIVAAGNGLQKDVWEKFKARFGIPEIREFYRSTEGIAKFDNMGNGIAGAGRVGLSGPLGRYTEDVTYLVRYDHDKQILYRDPKTGFCVPVPLGEPGEAIGRVESMDHYLEYLNNPEANRAKLVRDVFKTGDLFQRTGDLLLRDADGWVRFHDRTGDTFRWKGENVSAGEVRDFVSHLSGVHDVTVYAVKLNGYDGQAGAAAITLLEASPAVETALASSMYSLLRSRGLPDYAVPRLIRFTKQIATGHTFKHAKDVLGKRPWSPALDVDGDSLYWLDGRTYRKLDEQSWSNIEAGRAKV